MYVIFIEYNIFFSLVLFELNFIVLDFIGNFSDCLLSHSFWIDWSTRPEVFSKIAVAKVLQIFQKIARTGVEF